MSRAAESTHWYDHAGAPCYTQTKADGGLRNTTLADARKLLLRPSVTTIIKVADKPQINKWKERQLMMAFLTLPKVDGESLESLEARLWKDAYAHTDMAIARGTAIHAEIEQGFYSRKNQSPYYTAVRNELSRLFPNVNNWKAEESFSCSSYGGKIDLMAAVSDVEGIIVDFKVKEFKDDDNVEKFVYDEHGMQLCAYGEGLGFMKYTCVNIFVRPEACGGIMVKTYFHKDEDMYRQWKMFQALLAYWQYSKNYFCKSKEQDNE